MFWENLLDLVSTVEKPAQANFTTPVRSARLVIMKKVNFVLAVLPEKRVILYVLSVRPLILGNTAYLISLLQIPEHLKLDKASCLQVELASFRMKSFQTEVIRRYMSL